MILNTDQLRQKAHELALTHEPYLKRQSAGRLWRELYAGVKNLRTFIHSLQDGRTGCAQPAEEWLLDHAEFIEEQVSAIRHELSVDLLKALPCLRRSGETRVLSICTSYLEHVDGNLDEDSLVVYLNAYQEVAVLTIAEDWAVPLVLRIALIRRLAAVMELVRERREACLLVERLLARIGPAQLTPDVLKSALEAAGQNIPLSGPLIVQLVRHLRERADDTATVREWLFCKLENGPESLDRIISYEYQLQAAYQVTTGNLIGSLRKLSRLHWRDRFEQICRVEHTLRTESTGVYPRLDFSSRDVLRKRVEQLARRLRVPENLVAQQAVELAAAVHGQVQAERTQTAGGGANPAGLPVSDVAGSPVEQATKADAADSPAERAQADRNAGNPVEQAKAAPADVRVQAEPTPAAGNAGSPAGQAPAADGDDNPARLPAEQAALPRRAFAAYYLLEPDGVRELRRALKMCGPFRCLPETGVLRRAGGVYFTALTALFAAALTGFAAWIGGGASYTTVQWVVILLAVLLPASEWSVTAVHWLIETGRRPRPLLRYDFSRGVPAEASTMVVIPVIWSTVKEVREMADRLELHYLANRDPHIHFALLGDLVDAKAEKMPADDAVLEAAQASIADLNCRYSRPGGSTFHLFQRRRIWNSSEGVWMGWERKRGALVELVELLKGRADSTFGCVVGDSSVLPGIRYLITLDADTQLPLESAPRMIGTLHLPYNRPRLNRTKTRVVEGYGVLQPRIGVSYEASVRSRFAYLWSADPGIDPYTFAASDPYQDWLGQGIFTGKGIFDIDTFARLLCERIPENRVLSHDLLEGGFLRAGLLSDIELIDGHPSTFSAYQKRMHRWVRGDWQLLPWLLHRVRNRRGKLLPVDLSPLSRWQMIDNLRRSLLPPVLFAVLLLGPAILPGLSGRWLALVLVTLFLPLLRQLASIRRADWRLKSLPATAGQVLVSLFTLPFQSALLLDAIGRTLYRLIVSKRHLLEWVSAAEVERRNRRGRYPVLPGIYGGYALILLFAAATAANAVPALQWTGLALCAVWAAAPLAVRWLDRPVERPERPLAAADQAALRKLAALIWDFFEDYVTETDHWLPPDNVQIDPPNGIAHRTSPTNTGLYLAGALAARDLGFIDTPGLIERLERTVDTIERLDKWRGHLYNWYDTVTLEPLPPLYVSTVDSGNFIGSLIAVKEGLAEWLQKDGFGDGQPVKAEPGDGEAVSLHVAFAEELAPGVSRQDWPERGRNLIARLEALINATDFRPLYDRKAQLFHLGYHAGRREPDQVLYDLMASEARLASYIAIARGQVPVSHWYVLGRTMTGVGRQAVLLSWSGTMFEYLMPRLFMRTYRNTVWDSTYRAVAGRQIEYARQRGVPFGISESGYYAFDFRMNYQYRAFGVPGLGFKRGLEQDLVVAPYAAILALSLAKQQGLAGLRKMKELGALGKYGYYEAIDFTPERLPQGQTGAVVRSFMAHHQGMSLLALANLLAPEKIYARFHRDKHVRAAELLLQERIPARPKMIKNPAPACARLPETGPAVTGIRREYLAVDTAAPGVCVLSNGTFMTVVTNSGSGFSSCRGLAVTRWREDPVLDNWGSYIYLHDVSRGLLWSPTFQPCRVQPPEQEVQFFLDRAAFMREEHDIKTELEICVSPEWNAEIRRLTMTNAGTEARIIEATTYLEPVLAPAVADEAHPAFSKLFIQTEYAAQARCLLATRRPRKDGEKFIWMAHALTVNGQTLGPVEYETGRAAFAGRGYSLARPRGIHSHLRGTVGSVADPALIMRRRFNIGVGEQVQLFTVTAVADTREEVLDIAGRFQGEQEVERTFQLAWNRSQIELRHVHLSANDAVSFQNLAGRVLFTPPLGRERRQNIAANVKGQSGLWAYGVSGDLPVVLVRIEDRVNLPFVLKLLSGYEYLRHLGLSFDLVILNESAGGYQQDLQEALRRAVEQVIEQYDARSGGVFIINAGQLPEEDRTLLFAVARVVLQADGPSLRAQTGPPRCKYFFPAPLTPAASLNRFTPPVPVNAGELLFFNGWGGFSPDGREYRIIIRDGSYPPAPWINVIANPRFGCLVSERGTGYTWWRNSRECKLTPWSNDPVLDPPGEVCYLRDEASGEFWPAVPFSANGGACTVAHGRGYSRFQYERHGISQEMTVFVPLDDPVKVLTLRLRNRTAVRRRLSVTCYAEWVLGVQRRENAPFIITEWDGEARIMLARNVYQETFRDATAFLGLYVQPQAPAMTPDGAADEEKADPAAPADLSWTADRNEFLGRNGTLENPAALGRQSLSCQTGVLYDTCGAVQGKFDLEPGGERTVYILLGCAHSREKAAQLAQKYNRAGVCAQELTQVREFWDGVLDQLTVSTPSPETNLLLNGWLLYQALGCRIRARSAFYQAGGAYGFRDQLQDALALLHSRPDLTRAQILLHAAHQYGAGDVQHWWHEETQRGIRTLFSDDLLWLPYAVARYVGHTADAGIMDEPAPYLHSEPLANGEEERYEQAQTAGGGTVYEHCLRAVDRVLERFGEHGLPLIGSGDWNDGLSNVGVKGRGESVWLGWFLYDVLNRFTVLCRERGDGERARRYRDRSVQLASALDQHAWDGQWYRRAFTDAGQWLGSINNEECRIDAIAQSWAAIAGAVPPEKALPAMQSFDRELVDRELSVARLLTPPFGHTQPGPGYIQGYPPGIRENGAQYTHGVIWSIIAWCRLGNGDKAFELFSLLNPLNHARTVNEARHYGGEPYVMAADVYTAEPHKGRAGWTWYTGAAGWMYQAGVEWILGLRRRGTRLYIRPCIPGEWPEYSVRYRFGGAQYLISVKNPSHRSGGVTSLRIDGREVALTEQDRQEGPSVELDNGYKGPYVELKDDGRVHQIELVL